MAIKALLPDNWHSKSPFFLWLDVCSLSWASTKHCTLQLRAALETDGRACVYVFVSEWWWYYATGERRDVVEMGLLYRLARGYAEAPQTTTAAPILAAQNKMGSLSLYPQCLGHPACHRGRLHQSTVRSPRFTPRFLSLPGAVCSAKQNNMKQRPNYPGLTAFTCDPHSSDEALTNRVRIKPSAYNEVK